MSKLFSFRYNSSPLRFGLKPWQFQNNVCTHENKHRIPVMIDGLQEVLFRRVRLFGDSLVSENRGAGGVQYG